jgi:hypothetical protein
MKPIVITTEDEAIDLIDRVATAAPYRHAQDPNDLMARVEQLAQILGSVVVRVHERLSPELQLHMMTALLDTLQHGVLASGPARKPATTPTPEQHAATMLDPAKSRTIH